MEFSKAQFEAVINDIDAGMATFSGHLNRLGPVATDAANRWYVPEPVAEAIVWLANKSIEIGSDILALLSDLLKGVIAPIYMFGDAWEWMDVRGMASATSAALSDHNLRIDDSSWSGKAKSAYATAANAQSNAAGKVASIASSTSIALGACALAGSAFYVTLAAVLAKLIAAAAAAIAAFGSAVFSWAGAALILEEASVTATAVTVALGALTGFLTAQATAMIALHGEAVDQGCFPNGRWPLANASGYSDATVTDGDADWSLGG